eukprot:9496709-Pyramimonas_sp.AAC.1
MRVARLAHAAVHSSARLAPSEHFAAGCNDSESRRWRWEHDDLKPPTGPPGGCQHSPRGFQYGPLMSPKDTSGGPQEASQSCPAPQGGLGSP